VAGADERKRTKGDGKAPRGRLWAGRRVIKHKSGDAMSNENGMNVCRKDLQGHVSSLALTWTYSLHESLAGSATESQGDVRALWSPF
jgi:hypothetical protein